jgi:hypothetical protein
MEYATTLKQASTSIDPDQLICFIEPLAASALYRSGALRIARWDAPHWCELAITVTGGIWLVVDADERPEQGAARLYCAAQTQMKLIASANLTPLKQMIRQYGDGIAYEVSPNVAALLSPLRLFTSVNWRLDEIRSNGSLTVSPLHARAVTNTIARLEAIVARLKAKEAQLREREALIAQVIKVASRTAVQNPFAEWYRLPTSAAA